MSTTLIQQLSFTELADTTERVVAETYKRLEDLAKVKGLYTVDNVPANSGTQRIFTFKRFLADISGGTGLI